MKNKKGFTIVELVIVIAVIAILAAVLIPTFSGVIGKANISARTQEFTNALKVVLASNAETGGLAAGTIFISDDGYYAIYNGNKLGEITLIADEAKGFALSALSETAKKVTYTIGSEVYKIDNKNIEIQSAIILFENGTPNTESLKTINKIGGGDGTSAATWTSATSSVTVNTNLELTTFVNLDLPKGFVVLSPSTSK